ncbi:MAG: MurT ligase domain-containing protein, partial [Moorellales bacterium]
GRVALWLYPSLLSDLASVYQRILVVTGTNGKTTTARALAEIMRQSCHYEVIAANPEGANLLSGVATALLKHAKVFLRPRARDRRIAVLEVDEGTMEKLCRRVRLDLVVVTNIFRDQLDRYWELGRLADSLRRALELQPQAKLILNADDPLVASLGRDRPDAVYYGLSASDHSAGSPEYPSGLWLTQETRDNPLCPACGHPLIYSRYRYSHLGEYYCPRCSFARPQAHYTAKPVLNEGQASMILYCRDRVLQLPLALRGTYNCYNALAAAAAALELGVDQGCVAQVLAFFTPGQGRAEEFYIGHSRCTLVLVKNPTGVSEALRAIKERCNGLPDGSGESREEFAILLAINDLAADGRDVSWLWDCDWSPLLDSDWARVICSGLRAYDLAVCLKYFGLDPGKIKVIPSLKRGLRTLISSSARHPFREVFVLCTYTNLSKARTILRKVRAERLGDREDKDWVSIPRAAQPLR